MKDNGIEPAPDRKQHTSWTTFLKPHWETLAAIDFTTVEIWSPRGLVTMYLLIVMDLKSPRVKLTGITANPDVAWVRQMARNLTDVEDGFLNGHTHLMIDRDTKFLPFRDFLEQHTNVKPVLIPPRTPNCNAFIERFFLSLKSESLDQMIFFNVNQLRTATNTSIDHYHTGRNHQGLENRLIEPGPEVGQITGEIDCREQLGGLLRYYHRRAA